MRDEQNLVWKGRVKPCENGLVRVASFKTRCSCSSYLAPVCESNYSSSTFLVCGRLRGWFGCFCVVSFSNCCHYLGLTQRGGSVMRWRGSRMWLWKKNCRPSPLCLSRCVSAPVVPNKPAGGRCLRQGFDSCWQWLETSLRTLCQARWLTQPWGAAPPSPGRMRAIAHPAALVGRAGRWSAVDSVCTGGTSERSPVGSSSLHRVQSSWMCAYAVFAHQDLQGLGAVWVWLSSAQLVSY